MSGRGGGGGYRGRGGGGGGGRGRGRGRGRGADRQEQQQREPEESEFPPLESSSPESPPSSESPTSPASNGNGAGRGRGRGRRDAPAQPPGSPEKGAAAAAASELTKLSIQKKPAEERATKAKPSKTAGAESPENFEQAMARPGVGKEGRKIKLFANHFPLKIPANLLVHHYDFAVAREFKRKKDGGKASAASATKQKQRKGRQAGAAGEEEEEEQAIIDKVIQEDGEFEIILRRRSTWPKWLIKAIYAKLVTDPNFGLTPYRYKMGFDGVKNVFAQCPLPIPRGDGYRLQLQIPDEDRIDNFVVYLNHVAEVIVDIREVFNRNLVERQTISTQILDVILRQSKMFSNVFISIGSRAFYAPPRPDNLGGGLWRYPGIWSSVRPISGWKSTINLDVANTSFVKSGPILDFLNEIAPGWENRGIGPYQLKALEKLVRGIKVDMVHRHAKRSARCVGVSRETAAQLTFPCPVAGPGNKTAPLSVVEYFKQMHKRGEFVSPVQFPKLPCLQVGSKVKRNYIPLEFCHIKEGQRFSGKLSDQQTSAMLKVASTPAPVRKAKIEEEAKHFGFNDDPYMKSFGLTFEMKMMNFDGRVLTAPKIEHGNGQTISPKDGEWRIEGSKVIKGATINCWGVINADQRTSGQAIETFCQRLMGEAGRMGITFTSKEPVDYVEDDTPEHTEKILEHMKKKAAEKKVKLDLVFVILATKNSLIYSSTKSAGDVVLGVNTQCVLGKNAGGGHKPVSGALCANILLKINAKLGGINSKLVDGSKTKIPTLYKTDPKTKQVICEPVLILGADVNHPAPTDPEGTPSVAAVVANMDLLPAQYAAKIMVQARRQEPIAELQKAVEEMIYNFAKNNGRMLPSKIIMYRDGVGESMFLKVLTHELHAIRRACETMGAYFKVDPYKPPITFIVVQKRHHTRLFCADVKDQTGRGQNVPPGTIVDTSIVHPEEYDFYLCSHLGLQGTSRPTHYHVLWDDNDFTADELQTLTYYVCHTYARASKSVSIPPPCYYADLVAYRARQYLTWKWPSPSETASGMSEASTVSLTELQNHVTVQENITNGGMYFV